MKNYLEVLYDNEELRTPRLLLRKFRKTDAPDVFEWASDEETVRWLRFEAKKSVDECVGSIVNIFWSRPGFYAIELRETGKCIGGISLRLKPDHEKAKFGYVLNRAFWNRGYMTEALSALLKLCFEELELNRVESTYYVGNEASGRVMEKAGLRREGQAVGQEKVKGVFMDLVHLGIKREQYFKGTAE